MLAKQCNNSKNQRCKEEPNGNIRKNTITEKVFKQILKTQLNGLNSKIEMTKERISDLENKAVGMIQSQQ